MTNVNKAYIISGQWATFDKRDAVKWLANLCAVDLKLESNPHIEARKVCG